MRISMDNNKKITYFILKIIALSVFIFWIISIINKRERNKFPVESVAKIVKFKGASKRQYLDFIYYHDGKIYEKDWYRGSHPKVKVGDYYKIIYSSKNPKNVEIFLDEKITDTTLIKNAGLN